MEKVKAILVTALGEKAASDFIKLVFLFKKSNIFRASMEVDDVQSIKKRVCSLIDTRKPENRHVYEVLMRERIRRSLFNGEGYRKININPNSLCDDNDVTVTNQMDKENSLDHISNFKSKKKQKLKFQPLFCEGAQGDQLVSLLPGRHPCQCLATKHQLINNCTKCGRIVCEQENSGPCYYCGSLVVTKAEEEQIGLGTKQSMKLQNKLSQLGWASGTVAPYQIKRQLAKSRCTPRDNCEHTTQNQSIIDLHHYSSSESIHDDFVKPDELESTSNVIERLEQGLFAALLNRDRLIDYDVSCIHRTRVIDDELDYFTTEGGFGSTAWISPDVRERVASRVAELKSQRHASHLQSKRLCINLDDGSITQKDIRDEAAKQLYNPDEALLDELKPYSDTSPNRMSSDGNQKTENPNHVMILPKFTKKVLKDQIMNNKLVNSHVMQALQNSTNDMRIQDTESKQIVDKGYCMSLNQPWASLLVHGIKRNEDRSWYSSHRGCLWIASTKRMPDPEETNNAENKYIQSGISKSELPSSYPTSCLLGRVNVVDVLTNDEYHTQYPDEYSESPFVFICHNPQILMMKFPIRGKHKIYKLENQIRNAAIKNLI